MAKNAERRAHLRLVTKRERISRQIGDGLGVRPHFSLPQARARVSQLLTRIFHDAGIAVSIAVSCTYRFIDPWAVPLALRFATPGMANPDTLTLRLARIAIS